MKGTGKGGRIAVRDVYAAERTTSGHQAPSWLFVAVLAVLPVLALVFGPKIIGVAEKEDTSNTGSQPASTYTPRAPPAAESHDVSDPATEEAAPASRPRRGLPGGDRHAPETHRPDPRPGHQRHRRPGRRHPPGPGIRPDRAASDADDPDVRSAVSALAADARTMGASLRDPGDSGFHAARDETSSDLEDPSSACEGSSKS
ncbi:hypothetical protein ABZX74_34545 [Streptomyces olivaceoviridis]|uniref:hypothetical protein n=1 Tax=Streptomyces olivaceoviridis TaxID=1921 RepID=UPI0033A05FE5